MKALNQSIENGDRDKKVQNQDRRFFLFIALAPASHSCAHFGERQAPFSQNDKIEKHSLRGPGNKLP
jgi:hypothetical protein